MFGTRDIDDSVDTVCVSAVPVLTEIIEGEETDSTYDLEEEEEVLEGKGKGKAKVKDEEKKVESLRWMKMFRGNQCGGCWGSTEDCEVSLTASGRK